MTSRGCTNLPGGGAREPEPHDWWSVFGRLTPIEYEIIMSQTASQTGVTNGR